jgi:hypothetical protein
VVHRAVPHRSAQLRWLCVVLALVAVVGGCWLVGHRADSGPQIPVNQWWIVPGSRPNHEVRPLPNDAPPALVSREQAIKIATRHVQFEGEPTVVAHGLTEITVGVWESAWVIVEWYPNPTPHAISGPCCSPHFAVTRVAGVAISDQTGEFLIGWQNGQSQAPPGTPDPPAQ